MTFFAIRILSLSLLLRIPKDTSLFLQRHFPRYRNPNTISSGTRFVFIIINTRYKHFISTMPPKKNKHSTHFSVNQGDPFEVTDHSFKVVIRGRPLVWKRVGWRRHGGTFTPSKPLQDDFCGQVRNLFILNGIPILHFGDAELEASFSSAFLLP